MDINKLGYNPVVYLIEDEAERERCQFVYPTMPFSLMSGKQCKRDGKYRIGGTIFLCSYHMPGAGRRLGRHNPVVIKAKREKEKAVESDSLAKMQPDPTAFFVRWHTRPIGNT